VVNNIVQSLAMKPLVITGFQEEQVRHALRDLALDFAHNPNWEEGMGSSLSVAANEVSNTDMFVFLGDMPFIKESTLNEVRVKALAADENTVIVPVFEGKRGHPVYWGAKALTKLKKLGGDVGGKLVLQSGSCEVIDLPVDDPGVLQDIDTRQDLVRFTDQQGS
jgi:molybdenum cofactor cytidylyltransferase